jgi:hypothetical protein
MQMSQRITEEIVVLFLLQIFVVLVFEIQHTAKLRQTERIIRFFCNVSICNWRWSCLSVSVLCHQNLRQIELSTLWSTLNIIYLPCSKHIQMNLFPSYCTNSYIKATTSCFGHTCFTKFRQFQYNIVFGK